MRSVAKGIRRSEAVAAVMLLLLLQLLFMVRIAPNGLMAQEALIRHLLIEQIFQTDELRSPDQEICYRITEDDENPTRIFSGGMFDFILSGNCERDLTPLFVLENAGIYQYTLQATTANGDGRHVDHQRFYLEFYCTDTGRGRSVYLIIKNEKGEKLDGSIKLTHQLFGNVPTPDVSHEQGSSDRPPESTHKQDREITETGETVRVIAPLLLFGAACLCVISRKSCVKQDGLDK